MKGKKYPYTNKLCSNCGHNLYYLLEGVYAGGDDELICSNCGCGIKLKVYLEVHKR